MWWSCQLRGLSLSTPEMLKSRLCSTYQLPIRVLQAAQAMQQYSGWAPKEFDEAALDTGAAATDPSASSAEQQQQQHVAGQAGGVQQPRPAPDPSTFVYDPNTGAPPLTYVFRGSVHKLQNSPFAPTKRRVEVCDKAALWLRA